MLGIVRHARASAPGYPALCRAFSSASSLISTASAAALVGQPGVRFIDVRDPRIFDAGHVAGAANAIEFFSYLATSTPVGVNHLARTFERVLTEKGVLTTDRLITYEDSMRGMYGASCRGWYLLR
ncbi:hypothetical protein T492DRAFT_422288 [Pavlovales sp. CCMP2436]|nr:hypothetical protein T492DRAFT_422288 [Pavlovales sp. CCMP2436]